MEMARVVGEILPRFVFVENTPALTSRGLGVVLGDLAALGYDQEWGVIGAHHAGAPHRRDRIWILGQRSQFRGTLADPCKEPIFLVSRRAVQSGRDAAWDGREDVADSDCGSGNGWPGESRRQAERRAVISGDGWWQVEPDVGRVAHGMASRMDRLRSLGNGQVPAVAALAFRILYARLKRRSTK